MYDFKEKLAEGQKGEELLDQFFSQYHQICRATDVQQRMGIDRFFKSPQKKTISLRAVEYKTDSRAHKTGNAFIETISVYRGGKIIKLGWSYTSKAEWLMYFLPATGQIYHAEMTRVRSFLPTWEKAYPTKNIFNHNYLPYFTKGLLVPLSEFQRLCCVGVYQIFSPLINMKTQIGNQEMPEDLREKLLSFYGEPLKMWELLRQWDSGGRGGLKFELSQAAKALAIDIETVCRYLEQARDSNLLRHLEIEGDWATAYYNSLRKITSYYDENC